MTTQAAPYYAMEREQAWFSAAELAELALPGLPGDKRSITRRAREERWASQTNAQGALLARPRRGRGGGIEFHADVLPPAARIELTRRGVLAEQDPLPDMATTDGSWTWFLRQPAKVRDEAEQKLKTVQSIEAMIASGMTKSAAVAEASLAHGTGMSTLWAWLRAVEGLPGSDRLPALATRRTGGGRKADMAEDLWKIFRSDYLRPAEPTLTSCYRRTAAIAAERGWTMPSERTFRRRLEREMDPAVLMLRRKGAEAERRSMPETRRTVEHLQALEWVNADGHRFDVFVQHPTKRDKKTGQPTVIRPTMLAIQDVRSSKVLAWRIGETESAALVRLAFADLFRDHGIPQNALLDNGRGFASKWITGATANRFRFKVKPEDPRGLLTMFDVKVRWALPFRGQSKPIERAFRDLCDTIAKHPAMDGAYTGNSPTNKPHDYGKRAIAWEDFVAHVARGIAEHNARLGRRGRDYAGRSFDQVYAETYARSTVRKATSAQVGMALLTAEQKRVNRRTGEINLFGNRYWSQECGALRGQLVSVRFDPDNLDAPVHLYRQKDGAFLTTADLIGDYGWGDVAGAKASARRLSDLRRRTREQLELERLHSAEELAAMQPMIEQPDMPDPGVVQIVPLRGQTAAALKPRPAPVAAPEDSEIVDALGAFHLRLVD